MEPIRLKIDGLLPAATLDAARAALQIVPGVMSVRADPGSGELRVEAAESVDPDELIAAAQKAGCVATLLG